MNIVTVIFNSGKVSKFTGKFVTQNDIMKKKASDIIQGFNNDDYLIIANNDVYFIINKKEIAGIEINVED